MAIAAYRQADNAIVYYFSGNETDLPNTQSDVFLLILQLFCKQTGKILCFQQLPRKAVSLLQQELTILSQLLDMVLSTLH